MKKKHIFSFAVAPALAVLLPALPVAAQGEASSETTTLAQAATNIEVSIQKAMGRAGQSGQPTLGQLGGVAAGSTSVDSGGNSGGGSGGSGSSSSDGSGGGSGSGGGGGRD